MLIIVEIRVKTVNFLVITFVELIFFILIVSFQIHAYALE